MMDDLKKCVIVYCTVAVLTFGYAANAEYDPKVMPAANIFTGVLAGYAWPFYLSYKAFAWARP